MKAKIWIVFFTENMILKHLKNCWVIRQESLPLMNTESFLSKSYLNATKIQHNRPTKIHFKSLKRATKQNFKRYCPRT